MSLTTCEYHVVDVFAERPFEGNPLAVFPRAARLDRTVMQRIAGELNLCETGSWCSQPAPIARLVSGPSFP